MPLLDKEARAAYNKEYFQKNKEILIRKANTKVHRMIECDICNAKIQARSVKKHNDTMKHKARLPATHLIPSINCSPMENTRLDNTSLPGQSVSV